MLRFRSAVGSIYDFMDLPVPFIYTSFVAIVCILYPSLFSATVALCFDTAAHTRTHAPNEIIGLFLSLFNGFFFCGLRTIATKFQDPFDHSYEDLSVLHFARFTIEASAKILQRDPPAPLDEGLEWELQAQRQWGKLLGGAWAGGAEAEAEAPPGEGGAAHAGVPMPAHVC